MTKTLIEWQHPKSIAVRESKARLKGVWKKIILTNGLAAALVLLAYAAFSKLPVDITPDIKNGLISVLGMAIFMSFVCYLAAPFLLRFSPRKYIIKEKGILFGTEFISWSKIVDFSINNNPDYPDEPDLGVLTIITKYGKHYKLPFTDEFPTDKALSILHLKVIRSPKYEYLKTKIKLKFTKLQKLLIAIICVLFYPVLLSFLASGKPDWLFRIDKEYASLIMLCFTIFLGPGSLAIVLTKGLKSIRKNTNAVEIILAINSLTLFAIIIFSVIFEYFELLNGHF